MPAIVQERAKADYEQGQSIVGANREAACQDFTHLVSQTPITAFESFFDSGNFVRKLLACSLRLVTLLGALTGARYNFEVACDVDEKLCRYMQRPNRMREPRITEGGINLERARVLTDSVQPVYKLVPKQYPFPREEFHLPPNRVFDEPSLFRGRHGCRVSKIQAVEQGNCNAGLGS